MSRSRTAAARSDRVTFKLGDFGSEPCAGGWKSNDQFPRELADVNGDGKVDIVGFGGAGVYLALGNGDGSFRPIAADLQAFGTEPGAGGWTFQDRFPRHVADVDHDGAADIIGFGYDGVYESLSQRLSPGLTTVNSYPIKRGRIQVAARQGSAYQRAYRRDDKITTRTGLV